MDQALCGLSLDSSCLGDDWQTPIAQHFKTLSPRKLSSGVAFPTGGGG